MSVTDWTVADKKKLLMAIQQCGINNIAKVQTFLPDKTITDIRLAFEKYSALAAEKDSKKDQSNDGSSAISQWVKIVEDTNDKSNGIIDILPRVLKYIAYFEERPYDQEVNLRDCYMALSEMCNGSTSKKLNEGTSRFFFDNLSKLATKIRKDDNSKKKHFIRNMKNLDNVVKPQIIRTYNRKKKKVNTILNPLNIPDDLLYSGSENSQNDNL